MKMSYLEFVVFVGIFTLTLIFILAINQPPNITLNAPENSTTAIYTPNMNDSKAIIITLKPLNDFEKKMGDVQIIMNDVYFSHNYSRTYPDIYDCTDFSKELIKQLTEKGYKAHCVFGTYKGKLHTWVLLDYNFEGYFVEIPLEATSGDFIDFDLYNKLYEKRSEGNCL